MSNEQSHQWRELAEVLHGTNGGYCYFWTKSPKRSFWYQGSPPDAPGQNDLYFGVHPMRQIPTTNAQGKPSPPESVRGQNEHLQQLGGLFAEFDNMSEPPNLEPEPSALIRSGGGYHAYWFLEEPLLVQDAGDLETARKLQAQWVEYVGGDPAAKDLARVLRVPGTLNTKYDPPRQVEFVSFSHRRYPLDQLDYLSRLAKKPALVDDSQAVKFTDPLAAGGHGALVQLAAHLEEWGATPNDAFNMLRGFCDGRPDEREKSDDEIQKALEWGRGQAEKGRLTSHTTWQSQGETLPAIEWAWLRWLPRGFVSLLVGAPELGKSGLALRLAHSMISGACWPDGTFPPSTGGVVWLDTEAAEAINLERAQAWGVDTRAIIVPTLDGEIFTEINLLHKDGWASFESAVKLAGIQMVVIDSLGGAYVRESRPEVKELVKRLAHLARETNMPILMVHHPRKLMMGEAKELTLDRVRGYSGIVQFCREVWAVERPDPFEPMRSRLKVIKSNFSKKPEALGFELTDAGVVFTDAPSEPEVETNVTRAKKLILEMTANAGHEVRAGAILEAAEQQGIPDRALRAAKDALYVTSEKRTGGWVWIAPVSTGIQIV